MNGVSVLPSIKRSARSKQSALQRCYFNSPFSSDLYRFRKYAGGQTERRRVLYSVGSPPARWVAASATVKFTILYMENTLHRPKWWRARRIRTGQMAILGVGAWRPGNPTRIRASPFWALIEFGLRIACMEKGRSGLECHKMGTYSRVKVIFFPEGGIKTYIGLVAT